MVSDASATQRQPQFGASSHPVDQQVCAMRPITLEEMDGVRLMDRVDTKFAIRDADLVTLLAAVADQYRVLEVGGVRRMPYSTLYFDTPQRDCYRDHHNGRLQRWKYRMRRYGPGGPAFFEVKRKTNKGRTVKRRVPIPDIDLTLNPEAAELASGEAGRSLGLVPQMWTSFTRTTLVDHNGQERVTMDLDLTFHDQAGRTAGLSGIAVVEVKQQRHSRLSPISRQLRQMRVAPLRLSKYCVGSVLLDPNLKCNRFKPRLRALRALSQ